MAYQKLQVSNGLAVIPSNTVRIPNPDTEVLSGNGDFAVAGVLADTGVDFKTTVQVGDIVYNTAANKAYYVSSIDSATAISLTPSDAGTATDTYVIYREATKGCILFTGGAGDISIQLAQKNGTVNTKAIVFKGIAAGAFLPIQSLRVSVTDTTATDIVALW